MFHRTLMVFFLVFIVPAAAQYASLTGEVVDMPAGEPHLQVELRPLAGNAMAPPERILTDNSGRFQFTRISTGQYELVLTTNNHAQVGREIVQVGEMNGPVQVRYRGQPARRAGKGAVSLARLQHRVPKNAVKAFRKAGAARDRGKSAEAERLYREAIDLDAGFLEALNDLGTLLYSCGRYHESLLTLQVAQNLDPHTPIVLANLSAALLALQRFQEAEVMARQSVAADSSRIRSRFLLGLSRAAQKKFDGETRELLAEAATQIPRAHLALAHLYTSQGDRNSARQHLQSYLHSKDTGGRPQVERWLNSLR